MRVLLVLTSSPLLSASSRHVYGYLFGSIVKEHFAGGECHVEPWKITVPFQAEKTSEMLWVESVARILPYGWVFHVQWSKSGVPKIHALDFFTPSAGIN